VAAIAVAVLVLGLVGIAQLGAGVKNSRAKDLEDQRGTVTTQLVATKENGKRLKELDAWDGPVWGDELYELTARINDVNALQLVSINAEPIARTGSSKFAGRMTIKGKLLNKTNARKPLDDLISAFRREGYYSPQAPKVESDNFTLVVNLERRPPGEYKSRLEGKAPEKDKAKGK
jgi:hypothetical protein